MPELQSLAEDSRLQPFYMRKVVVQGILSAIAKPCVQRTRVGFVLRGRQVCKGIFCFAYQISPRTMDTLLQNSKLSAYSLPSGEWVRQKRERTLSAVRFLQSFAEQYGLQNPPGRGVRKDGRTVWFLPAGTQRTCVYNIYVDACQHPITPTLHPLCRKSFLKVWTE